MFRIALAQMNSTMGDLRANGDRALDFARRAAARGADLVCFPELALTGYPPEDLVFLEAFVDANLLELERVAREAPDVAMVVGYVDRAPGGGLYDSAALLYGGSVQARYHKTLLPNYSVFDEHRYFQPGTDCPVVVLGGVALSMVVCEDLWSDQGPVARAAEAGARLIVSPNASPYHVGKVELRQRLLCRRSLDHGVYIAYANMVGGQDELVFDGGSLVYGCDGTLLSRAPAFEEALLVVDLDLPPAPPPAARPGRPEPVVLESHAPGTRAPEGGMMSPTLELEPETYGALVLATRDYVRKNGFKEVVIGLSGGVDSSLVATIAVDALERQQVLGILMPSRYSSEGSVHDALALARSLGIRTETLGIEPAFTALLGTLEPVLGEGVHGLTEENLQARVRGTLLMAISNARGSLVLTTGNKSELSTGYSTLYGDMAGGFAVIKDVEKSLVFRLCRWRNAQSERDLVPNWVIEKPPSAELRPDQRDTDSLPPYSVLDPILRGYVEENLPPARIAAMGYDEELVKQVIRLVDRSEYKRRQAAPGPRITERALGKDRRMPITSRFRI